MQKIATYFKKSPLMHQKLKTIQTERNKDQNALSLLYYSKTSIKDKQ
jgi:hypothetical protein